MPPILAAICVRLDGLPLAIELAAARLKLLSPHDLLRRLDRRLALLTGGARDLPERHQTLRATIEWSYRLLDNAEQRLFASLAVFNGSWSLAAAEAVCVAPGVPMAILDGLAALTDKSLVRQWSNPDGSVRFGMLATIHEFATEQLEARGLAKAMSQTHAQYFMNWCEGLDFNARDWLPTIDQDLDNLRAALRWALQPEVDPDTALRIGHVLGHFCYWRDWLTEGRRWLEQALAHANGARNAQVARVLASIALMATNQGDTERARELHETNLQMCEELHLYRPQITSLIALGTAAGRQAQYDRAIECFEAAVRIARQHDNPEAVSNSSYMLAGILLDQGLELQRAISIFEECLQIARDHGLHIIESMTLATLGITYTFTGQTDRAAELLPAALRIQRELNATMAVGWTLLYQGMLAYRLAAYEDARQHFVASLAMTSSGGGLYIAPPALEGLAGVIAATGQPWEAARLLGASEALREGLQMPVPPIEQTNYQEIVQSVQHLLPPDQVHSAWQVGRSLSPTEAITLATSFAAPDIVGSQQQERHV